MLYVGVGYYVVTSRVFCCELVYYISLLIMFVTLYLFSVNLPNQALLDSNFIFDQSTLYIFLSKN